MSSNPSSSTAFALSPALARVAAAAELAESYNWLDDFSAAPSQVREGLGMANRWDEPTSLALVKSDIPFFHFNMGMTFLGTEKTAKEVAQALDQRVLGCLVDQEVATAHDRIQLVDMTVSSSTKGPQIADITLSIDGENKNAKVEGNGAVDAIFKAIAAIVPHDNAKLALFNINAVTGGTDAQAEVTVRLEEDGKTVNGTGSDTDTLVAACRAYVHALNKLMVKRARQRPEDVVTTRERIASI